MLRRCAVALLLASSAVFAPRCFAHPLEQPDPLEIFPPDSTTTPSSEAGPLFALSVPAYHSDPAASAKLYLNFTGQPATSWGGYVTTTTPAYDIDGNPSTFSSTELANINQMWQRVSEKYSPFNIDVTTEQPADMSPGHTQQVVIGGKGSWFGLAGGVSYVGAFVAGPNTSYVFPDNLAQSNHGVPKYVAEAIAHEAGHAFGLYHQSDYVNGRKTNEYSLGTYIYNPSLPGVQQPLEPGTKSPIMGNSYFAERGIWWKGTDSNGASQIQDDMSIISSSSNGFGYRPDESNNNFATASPLTIDGSGLYRGQGIIEQTSDRDYFRFQSSGGLYSFLVNVAPYAAMLDATADIYDSNGNLVVESATASLSELISANLVAGTYDLVVSSAGSYGDVGQYSITGSIGSIVPEPSIALVAIMFPVFRRRRWIR